MSKPSPPKPSRSLRPRIRTLRESDGNSPKPRNQAESNHDNQNSWDDWVPQDRVMKFNDDNKELAAQLHQEMKKMSQKPKSATSAGGKKIGGRTNGSDFGSGRGSEERHASVAAQGGGRGGPRRNRDYDLEQVSLFISIYSFDF
ncbi:uncharacterized protein EAF01_009541 [Botrytis porri]|uniref:uncharacterized protein n=1 Tax=Botrytis porri TaxID=87229 RepID=UPI0019004C88|nr:uncharacterized protein EAF01_009541 [Botrytis porri]KAF7895579.1 hypothetical protein EAF01_009541 [Botrytis porri]